MIKIIIVDDHLLFSKALRSLIDDFSDIKVIGQFINGLEFQNHFKNSKNMPDVVLMDVQMPVVNGVEATQWLKENHPNIKVLALTMNDEEETILKMLRAGAKGYLLKDIHPNVLHKAITETKEKGFYYTQQVSNTLVNANKIDSKFTHKIILKPREIELLKLAAQELTYKQIAEKMFLSPKTIDGYRERLFVKLDVKSRVGLVLYAIKEKLVD